MMMDDYAWLAVGIPIHPKDVEVRALCRPVMLFHTDLDKPFLYGLHFVHEGIVMLKQEGAFPKLLPQSWKHKIV